VEVRQLAARVKDASQARRLLAIAAVLDGASREPAHEKLLNRRYRAGALTSAPGLATIRMVSRRAEPMPLGCGLAIGHKKIARRMTLISGSMIISSSKRCFWAKKALSWA
jgi:hypothetical protein